MAKLTERKYRKSGLTPAKKKFSEVYAKTDNASEAVRQAYPDYVTTPAGIRSKGYDLLTNPDVSREIELQKLEMDRIASKAVKRIENVIENGKEHNALQAAMYTYDHTHGRPTQKIEQTNRSVTINIDLTSVGEAASVAQDTLSDLAE